MLALVGLAVLVPAGAASAHDELIESTPSEGETLLSLPNVFSVTMNENLFETVDGSTKGFGMTITDTSGAYYGDGCITIDGATMSTPAALGAPGDYTLTWQLVSSDGHPTNGEIHFTWNGAATGEGAAAAPTCDASAVTSAPSATPAPAASADGTIGVIQWVAVGVGILLVIGGISYANMRAKRNSTN